MHEPHGPARIENRTGVLLPFLVAQYLQALNPLCQAPNLRVAYGRLRGAGDAGVGGVGRAVIDAAATALQLFEAPAEDAHFVVRGRAVAPEDGLVGRRRTDKIIDAVYGRMLLAIRRISGRRARVLGALLRVARLGEVEPVPSHVKASADKNGEKSHAKNAGNDDDGAL